MTKKRELPSDLDKKIRGHVRAIIHLNMGASCRSNAARNKDRDLLRVINRIEKIKSPLTRDINDVLLMHKLPAADDLVALEAIHKAIVNAARRKHDSLKGMVIPKGWHLEEGLVSKQEFVVHDEERTNLAADKE